MLNPNINRNPLTRSAVLVTLALGLCITASLPAVKTLAAAAPASAQARVEPAPPGTAPVAPVAPLPATQSVPRAAQGQPEPIRHF